MRRYVSAEGAEACRFFPILLGVHTGHILCYVIPMLRLLGMGRGAVVLAKAVKFVWQ